MTIEKYRDFEIFQDESFFDLFSIRGVTIGDLKQTGSWNKRPSFKSVEDAKIYIDGFSDGYISRAPKININFWERQNFEDYSAKILVKKEEED